MNSDGYLLEKKSGCFKSLNWNFSYKDTTFTTNDLLSSLAQSKDWIEKIDGLYPKVITYETNNNHRVVIVPSTNRIDIRIHYTTPDFQRKINAHQLAESLASLCHSKY